MTKTLAFACLVFAACTTLGSMPVTTGVSAVPHGRPGSEAQLAIVPAFRLSNAASGQNRNGQSTAQLSALIAPSRWAVPGLVLGARLFGESGDAGLEPYVGVRRTFAEGVSFAAVGYGTKMGATEKDATYDALRIGGEVMADIELASIGSWGQLHVGGGINATYIDASGTYCVNADGDAIDCDENGSSPTVAGELAGVYTAGNLMLALDIARGPTGTLHLVRLGALFSFGHMPRLVDGRQQYGDVFLSGGVVLTLGVGADR
ncbi:MAG: hypothetical protein ACKV2T_18445 [Kofleriaceae bacterium]